MGGKTRRGQTVAISGTSMATRFALTGIAPRMVVVNLVLLRAHTFASGAVSHTAPSIVRRSLAEHPQWRLRPRPRAKGARSEAR
eukprot:2954324-Amphidinium_carterae.1